MEQPAAQPDRPPTADRRPPTADRRPPTTDRRDAPLPDPHDDPEATVDALEKKVSSEFPDQDEPAQNLPGAGGAEPPD